MQYTWDDAVTNVYQEVIQHICSLYAAPPRQWLNKPLSCNSIAGTVDPNGKVNVNDESPDSIAGQFYDYMPGHSFKVQYLIDHLDKHYALSLHTERACLAIVDIGCGGATATTALINMLLRKSERDTRFLFVGIDTNHCAVQLYDWMMQGYSRVSALEERIDYHAVIKGMPEVLTYVAEGLHQAKKKWAIPSLNDLWVIQSNVVRPLQNIWEEDKKARNSLGLDANRSLIPDDFGEVEARAYEQLLRLSEADRMLVMTVATNDDNWRGSSSQFGDSVMRIFSDRSHRATRLYAPLVVAQPLSVSYTNPDGSYWRTQRRVTSYTARFYADVEHIESQHFLADRDWQEIISLENLKLAWVRVRAAMIRESIVDEVDLKLFEYKLDGNLQAIRNRLLTYTTRLTDFPRLFYSVPKDEGKSRPRALQSIHEEVLAVAIIQVLGRTVQELMARNYGYRLDLAGNTEYLYRPWFRSYGRFRNAVRRALRGGDENGIIIRSDIANFYPTIPQEKLLTTVSAKLRIEANPRVVWLLRQLLLRSENEKDGGVLQGPLASGFWANLYLLELDSRFSDDYAHASFYRYVDDMVLVVPDASAKDRVLQDLRESIGELGLNLSDDKTDSESVVSALEALERDKTLDDLDKRFRQLTDGLYFTHPDYHAKLRLAAEHDWWKFIYAYQQCLSKLGVFVEASRLSRKVWQYVQNPLLRREVRKEFPAFDHSQDRDLWTRQFIEENDQWSGEYNAIKTELSNLLLEKWGEWKILKAENPDKLGEKEQKANLKNIQTYLSFTLNRLARLGYDQVLNIVIEIISNFPYVLKSPRVVIEHLALQGHVEHLHTIWQQLHEAVFPGISSLRALILRFFRSTEAVQNRGIIRILEGISVNDRVFTDDEFLVEALMATETLIFTPQYTPDVRQQKAFAGCAIQIKDRCAQLARNLLILAQRNGSQQEQYDLMRELMAEWYSLDNNYRTYQEPDFDSEIIEPEVVRKNYYYSRYPDNVEEFEGDYF
ncbi:MAG: hypothetical protein HS103_01480 [Anaerolineales bacterium]|nr:hypothetical protein [Anaerolineales bacterium]